MTDTTVIEKENEIPRKRSVKKFTKEQLVGIIDYAHKYNIDIAEMIPGLFDKDETRRCLR